ncbi:MAG TPA: Tad domain-containing protein [Candidatus Limnocylindria bacterium]|nr:Tad domain-containing protein [Candidatus Limnocylindria bacterium]
MTRDGGQSVVLVALMFTILLAGGAMGIDVGRFYAERRFAQSAVDAAALACALAYTRGGDAAAAWSAGDDVLQQRNLQHNPLGLTITYASRGAETYDNNIASPVNLNSGILPVTEGCRVAVTTAVPTYLIKIVSPALNTIAMTTRAYAKAKGGLLPSVVKRYLNPGDSDDNPTDDGANEFVDTTAQEGHDSACHAGSGYAPACIAATAANPGREIVLFGASQKADNDSSFRGYIALDVRNFEDASPPNSSNLLHDSYNGVAPNASVNTLKDYEATWIGEGYPGPDICVVSSTNFDKCAQIAVINGSSSGIFVDRYSQYFRVGDIGLFQLYDGTVKSVPDFTFAPPALTVPSGGAIAAKTVPFSMSSQFASTGSQICTDVVVDDGTLTYGPGDTTGKNPFTDGAISMNNSNATCGGTGVGNFSSNPTPVNVTSYNQTWSGMTATGAQQGIYQVFLRGRASAPYASRIHSLPVKVVVGGQSTEYDISSSQSQQTTSLVGLPATMSWNIVVGTGSGSTKWQTTGGSADGPITVSWEGCPRSDDPTPTVLACYIDTVGNTSKTVTAGTTVAVTVQTGGVSAQKSYYGWVRTVGTDHSGHPVVKLWQVRLDVDQQAGGTTQYVDVIGYAAYKITKMDSNDVYGRAVTGAYLDPNDPALAIAKKIVLVPWETP